MSSATQPVFAKDSWQTPRNARTLRTLMALRNQEIGARLRELRGSKPQTTVAEEIGVAERTYQNWEAGDAKPSYRNLQAIASYYGVGEDYILAGAETPTRTPPSSGESQLDRIEDKLDRLLAIFDEGEEDSLATAIRLALEQAQPTSGEPGREDEDEEGLDAQAGAG